MNDLNYGDDNFNFDAAGYQGANQAILPAPGVYRVKATAIGRKKDKNGQEVLTDGRWPVVKLNRIEILEPEGEGGQFAIFHDVSSKPYPRRASGGKQKNASKVVDLIRAINVDKMGEIESFDHAVSVAEQELAAGEQFNVKLGYKVLDIEGAKAALAQIDPNDTEAVQKAWSANTYRTKQFRDGNGYNTTVKTADGRTLQAKLVIDAFVDSNESTKLGPYFPTQA